MEQSQNKTVLLIVVLVIGLLVGGGLGYARGNSMENTDEVSQSAAPTTDTKAASLRVLLNNLESEHVDLAAAATRAGFDGDASFTAAAGALDENSNELADAIGSVYGAEARTKFYEIWSSHIGFFVDYTVAAKSGDMAGMDKAVQNLNGYVDAISDFLSGANPNLPRDAVAQLVTEHVGLLKEAVDKHGAADYAGSYDAQDRARVQITNKIADTLSGAIVKQNPESF
jgi:hypothetical protein